MACRVVFMGTPEFAVPCLAALAEHVEVVGVVTQPDRPRGRGQRLRPSPVKAWALAHGLPVFQPERAKDEGFAERLEGLRPDLAAVVAFGQILPQRVLDIPRLGCINVHASLLPKYRGAAPMQRCLIQGERTTGVTTMMMDAGMDTGDMLLREELPIPEDMTLAELHDALMGMGARLLVETVGRLLDGSLPREPQDGALATYAPMIGRETGCIDWRKGAREIHNLVRGLDSWPGAYTFLAGRQHKIWRTRVTGERTGREPGEILQADADGLRVAAGDGVLQVLELQAPGGKRMEAGAYLRGHGIALPARFAAALAAGEGASR